MLVNITVGQLILFHSVPPPVCKVPPIRPMFTNNVYVIDTRCYSFNHFINSVITLLSIAMDRLGDTQEHKIVQLLLKSRF